MIRVYCLRGLLYLEPQLGLMGSYQCIILKIAHAIAVDSPRPPRRGSVASCSDAGVLGPIPGLVGVLQSIETIKVLTGIGSSMGGRIGIFDGMDARFMVMKLNERRRDCEVCGVGEPNSTPENEVGNEPTSEAQHESGSPLNR